MSKSILVIDTPQNCISCPLHVLFLGHYMCFGDGRVIEGFKHSENGWDIVKQDCPLKPMPKEKEYTDQHGGGADDYYPQGVTDGWNACLDELEGET